MPLEQTQTRSKTVRQATGGHQTFRSGVRASNPTELYGLAPNPLHLGFQYMIFGASRKSSTFGPRGPGTNMGTHFEMCFGVPGAAFRQNWAKNLVCVCVAVWLCGCVAVWLCGCVCVAVCVCVCVALSLTRCRRRVESLGRDHSDRIARMESPGSKPPGEITRIESPGWKRPDRIPLPPRLFLAVRFPIDVRQTD